MTEDRSQIYHDTETFLNDHEDSAAILEEILAVDDGAERWEFSDVDLDSGIFGEVAATGLVEKVEGEYCVADREAVQAAIEGQDLDAVESDDADSQRPGIGNRLRKSLLTARNGLLVVALLFIAFMRSVFHYGAVYRDGTVVLVGNDPYRRRYWLERLVESDLQPWNPLDLGSLPELVTTTDTLFYWLTWVAAAILGNSVGAVSTVLAWYPIVMAMLTGLAVYGLAVRLTGDIRIGLASVFLLALIPIHATYTALGFGDHHALDYFLLTVIGWSLVVTVDTNPSVTVAGQTRSARLVGASCLGLALASMNAAWSGAPLWFGGVGVVVVALVTLAYSQNNSPLSSTVPILGALALAAALTMALSLGFGWLQPYRVLTPLLLFAGSGAVIASGEGAHRLDIPTRVAVPTSIGAAGLTTILAWLFIPPVSDRVIQFREYLQRTGSESISETLPLFSPELQVIGGPLSYLGGIFVLAMPALLFVTWVGIQRRDAGWLAATVFSWYLFAWASIQVRFAAELAPFFAVFAGVGFVSLLSWVDLFERPAFLSEEASIRPTLSGVSRGAWLSKKTGYVVGFFFFIGLFSFIFIPGFTGDIPVDDGTYEASQWIDDYSEEQGYEYPENYVFSQWSENRQYNYYVSGESDWYGFARQNYMDFISSEDPDEWYSKLQTEGRFVVLHDVDEEYSEDVTQATLYDRLGSRGEAVSGAGHYRARYVTENQTRTVFELVPGARLTGTGPPNEQETVEVTVDIDGKSFTYERRVETNEYGDYGVTVPYPGEYEIFSDRWRADTDAINIGEFSGSYRSHWTFNKGRGDTISDPVGGHSESIEHAEWTSGASGSALKFDGEGATVIDDNSATGIANGSFTVSFWIKGDLSKGDTDYPTALYREGNGRSSYGFWARPDGGSGDFGFRLDDIDGNDVRVFGIETTTFERWTQITAVFDRGGEEIRLYRNDSLIRVADATNLGLVADTGRLSIGGRPWAQYSTASIDSLRIYSTALDRKQIARQYNQNASIAVSN